MPAPLPRYARRRGEVLAARKFGPGGPFNPSPPGPWKDSGRVRGSAQQFSEQFKECVALMAQYVYDRFGKFPGTVPSILIATYLQAHHLDLEFYDHFFQSGSYLDTHAQHLARWHPDHGAWLLVSKRSRHSDTRWAERLEIGV